MTSDTPKPKNDDLTEANKITHASSDALSDSDPDSTRSGPEQTSAIDADAKSTPAKSVSTKPEGPKDGGAAPAHSKTRSSKTRSSKTETRKTETRKTDSTKAAPPKIRANKKVNTPGRGSGGVGWLALFLALLAVVGSAYTYWQQQQFTRTTTEQIALVETSAATLARRLEAEVQAQVTNMASDARALKSEIEQGNEQLSKALGVDVSQLGDRILENEQQLVKLKGYPDDVKYAYIKSEIEYFLQMANNRVNLAQDAGSAQAALEAADDRLNILRDPSLTGVRAQVLDEIEALKAVVQPDIEGITLRLSSLSKTVANLPLRMDDDQAAYLKNDIELKEGEGFRVAMSNVWRNMKGTLDQLVEVRDATPSDVPLLSVNDVALVYAMTDIQLQSARLAALKADAANYTASLEKAEQLLQVYFDAEEAKVSAILESLSEMKGIDITPELPDISKSLLLLRKRRSESAARADTPPVSGSESSSGSSLDPGSGPEPQ